MELREIFPTRNPERNRQNDAVRRERLRAAIQTIQAEVRSELDGIRRRYEAAATNAAFLFDAIENGESDSDARLDDLSASLKNYETRVAELSGQIEFLNRLGKAATNFGLTPAETDSEPTP